MSAAENKKLMEDIFAGVAAGERGGLSTASPTT